MSVDLKAGDIVCVEGRIPLISNAIINIEKFWSNDNQAEFGHSFIIYDKYGKALDTRWRVEFTNINLYRGQRMMIARPTHTIDGDVIEDTVKLTVLKAIALADLGKFYPVHRLFFHLFKPLAKYVGTGTLMVCSERTAKYLSDINAWFGPYTGVNPDMIVDEVRDSRNYTILFKGVW